MTPHIEAEKGSIAKTVLMPGDPLRAKVLADTYLKDAKLVNTVRNIYAYTGFYKGKEITVMASGMGMPSIGIYSYELFKFYDVDNIIRIGTAGSYQENIKLYDIILAQDSFSESTYAKVQGGEERNILSSNTNLNNIIIDTSKEMGIDIKVGRLHSSDVFYTEVPGVPKKALEQGCLACEMESFALFHNANILGKKATCLITISDNLVTHEAASAEERQNAFSKMLELALEASLKM